MKLPRAIGVTPTGKTQDAVSRASAHRGLSRGWLRRVLSRGAWLCGVALVALSSPVTAQTINTTTVWDGSSSISAWSSSVTETFGQSIVPTASQTKLGSFTFELSQIGGTTPMQYQAYVYQWDGGSRTTVGPALFTSAVLTAPSGIGFTPVTINAGSLALTAGVQYILFFSTTNVPQVSNGQYQIGKVPGTPYPAGTAYYSGSGQLSSLGSFAWEQPGLELAFIATFITATTTSSSSPPPITLFIPLFTPLLPFGAPVNPTNVAGALDKFTNAGGTLPAGFLNLLLLTPTALVNGLSQLSGENNTDAQQGTFELMNSYLSLLSDPDASQRSGGGGSLGFVSEPANARNAALPGAITSAYASMPVKAALLPYQPHWDSWGAAFGGSGTNRGDATVVGSHDSNATVGGVAAGADYRFSPDALAGFSLAGGRTSWNLSGGAGSGSSDAFLTGIYGVQKFGAAYVSGALSCANYWMTTGRNVAVAGADGLQANFNAQSYGGRLEGGYRIPTGWMFDVTPFAAVQVQSFHNPAYGEVAVGASSNQFALNFGARNATDVRTELGARADKTWLLADASAFKLFGKAAWAHDEVSDPELTASFIGLTPVASFVVNGAAPSHDLALLSGGAEWRLANGISLMAKFDGELSDRTVTYAGTGRIRYTW
jgi:outer membrane autotransporter protein